MSSFYSFLCRDEDEIEVVVEYIYHRAYHGARDSLGGVRGAGPPLEPDEPAGIEIESVTDEHNKEYVETLSEDELLRLEDEAEMHLIDWQEDRDDR
jgi:hypothetical protein